VIRKQSIEKIRSAVAECPDELLEREFDAFFVEQPEVCSFVMDVTSASTQTVRELSLFLSYVVYRVIRDDLGLGVPVSPEGIESACRESQEWIQRLGSLDAEQFGAESASAVGDELYLLGFVVSEVQAALEDGMTLADEEKGTIFFVLKTVIACMKTGSKKAST
jgi:hypothetical protein